MLLRSVRVVNPHHARCFVHAAGPHEAALFIVGRMQHFGRNGRWD